MRGSFISLMIICIFSTPPFLGLLRLGRRRRGKAEHAVGHGGGSAEGAGQRQEFAAIHLAGFGIMCQAGKDDRQGWSFLLKSFI